MSFPEKPSICQVLSLKDYLVRTAPLCTDDAKYMFIQLRKPYKCVSSQTLARFIVQLMTDAGVNTDIFKQHSTHSTLAAWIGKTITRSMAQICKNGSWLSNSTNFRIF